VDVDLWAMQDLLARAAAAPDPRSRVPLLREACVQYTGPLAGIRDYDWIGPHREAARRTAVEAHRQLAEALLESDARAAADVLDAAIAIDPYDEDLYRTAMRARHQATDPDGIRRLRRALTTALHDLDTEPSDETLELADQLTSGASPKNDPDVAGRKSAGATPLADAR
jgi:DNA-binding SARP family transcriptional activator